MYGATVHTLQTSMQVLGMMFPGRLISRLVDITWSSRSPDLVALPSWLRQKQSIRNIPCHYRWLKTENLFKEPLRKCYNVLWQPFHCKCRTVLKDMMVTYWNSNDYMKYLWHGMYLLWIYLHDCRVSQSGHNAKFYHHIYQIILLLQKSKFPYFSRINLKKNYSNGVATLQDGNYYFKQVIQFTKLYEHGKLSLKRKS